MPSLQKLACATLLGFGLSACDAHRDQVVQNVGSQGESVRAAAHSPAAWDPVPPFTLTNQAGVEMGLEDFLGQPFALAAIFTTCAGPCPTITGNMLNLQDQLRDTEVRLVSVSVDPETDTPEALLAYARSYGADTKRWSFLTGPEQAIFGLLQEGFWLGAERSELDAAVLGMQVSHAALVVAVDAAGNKRGWYDGTDSEDMALLAERLRYLESEER